MDDLTVNRVIANPPTSQPDPTPAKRTPRGRTPQRERRRRKVATHVLGTLATALAAGAYYVAMIVTAFGLSYCGAPTADSDVHRARVQLVVGAITMAAVPAATALVARHVRTATTPWWTIAALLAAFGVWFGSTIEPTMWCLF